MIKNYLKIAWRNFYKHKFYSAINVFGLSMGIGCSIILFLFISYHLSFDRYHNNATNIYRIVTDLHIGDGSVDYDEGSPLILGQTLKQQMPQIVKEAVLFKKRSFTVSVQKNKGGKQNLFYENENMAFANNEFFDVFAYNWLSGNAQTALTRPNTAVITAGLARKYFGTDDAIGRIVRLDNKYDIAITGVLQDNTRNTDISADLYISLPSVKGMYFDIEKPLYNDWQFISSKNNVFLLLDNERSKSVVENNIPALVKRALKQDAAQYVFHLQPLADIHFNSRYNGAISKPLLTILALVGIALLLIAGVNFVNMATAQSITRAKEIGTRKVLGSSPNGIFWQFIAETAYVALAATALALLLTFLFLPTLNSWLQLSLAINRSVYLFLAVLFIILVFAAGFYPAVVLSRFKPVNALKNIVNSSNPSSKLSRGILIVSQNTVAQLLIVCTLIITIQVKFLKNADMGFSKDAIIMAPLPQDSAKANLAYLRNRVNNVAGVKSISFCYSPPAAPTNKGGSVRYDGKPWENFTENSIIGDENYLATFDLKLLAGRNISATDTTTQYLINQQTLLKLDIKTPERAIGHKLIAGDFSDKPGTIVGVVKDFHSRPLYAHIEPTLIAAQPNYYRYAAIKIDRSGQHDIIGNIRQTWQKVYPQNVFEYRFLDQQINDFYQKEEMINKLIEAGSIVAILISCLGLLGLISLIAVQRTKEIGIRKVLGASVANITLLLSKDFLKLVLIAVAVASPIAWWVMNKWLQGFAYRIDMQWWLFALTAAATALITFISVGYRAISAAISNPVDSLRNE